MKRIFVFLAIIGFGAVSSLDLQAQEVPEEGVLTFSVYMNRVVHSNIEYLAEKYNVDIARANVQAARVFPDPELEINYANNQNWSLQMGYEWEAALTYTLELGGKRRARIDLAQSEKEMTEALLEDYFHQLRADAVTAYLAALKQREMYAIRQASYQQMWALAQADSIRFREGLIKEVEAQQSMLEAITLLNDMYESRADYQEALHELSWMQGLESVMLPDSLEGALSYMKRDFRPEDLVVTARNNRADLQAALKSRDVSRHNLRLAKANRMIDLDLSIGGGYSSVVLNEEAAEPAFYAVTAGVSIPLKFSNANKGELNAARFEAEQSDRQYKAVELEISTRVLQKYARYTAALQRVEQFNKGLLKQSEDILQKIIYSYEYGETSILEVLNAQRTYNDVQEGYYEALFDCSVALVELERACGVWDIEI